MISGVELHNFKSFADLTLAFRRMTLLTGLNSGGKSTIIQALLLARLATKPGLSVPLNGPYGLELGEAGDLLNQDAADQKLRIRCLGLGSDSVFEFEVSDERQTYLILKESSSVSPEFQAIADDSRSFVYLAAERLGPRDILEVAPESSRNLSVGHQGQYVAHVLSELERMPVESSLLFPSATPEAVMITTLLNQTEGWLSQIVCPTQIDANWLTNANAATIRFRTPGLASTWLRPANVGFGLSYALPIIVAGLTAKRGGLLVIENPEAHLHPAGQSLMGRFLARVAASGIQVVVETHSDHFLNGFRRAIAEEQVLSEQDAVVHYFEGGGKHEALTFDERGGVSHWPVGFFDQTEHDLLALATLRERA